MAWNEVAFVVLVAAVFLVVAFLRDLFELAMDLLFNRNRVQIEKLGVKRAAMVAGISLVAAVIAFQFI